MPQYIEVDGEVIEFPDDMSESEISSVLSKTPTVDAPDQSQAETARLASKPMPEAPVNQRFSPEAIFANVYGTQAPVSTRPESTTFQEAIVKPVGGIVKGITDIPVGVTQLAVNALGSKASSEKINTWVDAYNKFGDTSEATRFVTTLALPLPIKAAQGGLAARSAKGAGMGVAFGLTAPTSETSKGSYWEDKQFQAGLGGLIGGGLPIAGSTLGKIGEILSDVNISAKAKINATREYLVDLLGSSPEKAQKAINTIKNYGRFVEGSKPTVAQTLGDTPTATGIIAEEARVSTKIDQAAKFAERGAEQQAARMKSLAEIATPRGRTAQDVIAQRQAATAPMREEALARANVYGEQAPAIQAAEAAAMGRPLQAGEQATEAAGMLGALQGRGRAETEAAQAIERANNWTPVLGMPQFPGRYSPNTERAVEQITLAKELGDIYKLKKAEVAFHREQLRNLGERGYFPLQAGNIQTVIKDLSKARTLVATEGVPEALQAIGRQIDDITDANGLIDSHNLYAIRKNIGNTINSIFGQKSITPDAKLMADATNQIQKAIDASINKAAGNTTWTRYLNLYSKYSDKIDRMRVGERLVETLGGAGKLDIPDAAAFAKAVNDSAPLVQKATGKKTLGGISDVLTESEMKRVENVIKDLRREARSNYLQGKTERPSGEVGGALPSVNLLDRRATILESIYRYAKQGNQQKMDSFIADLMLDPDKFVDFVTAVPKGFMDNMMKIMFKTASPETSQALIQGVANATSAEISK